MPAAAPDPDLDGATAIVTGAASGIGREVAGRLAAAGARVFAADRVPADADGTDALHPGALSPVVVDVSRPEDFSRLVGTVVAETGRIDILCNNAGVASTTDVVACSPDEWDEVFAVNVRGVFLGIKYAVPHMLDQGGGVIVNTASAAGLVGLPDRAAYCASKGAVVALTRQVAIQYAGNGIRCNCVCPGTVDTPWVGRLLADSPEPDALRRALEARQPMGRLATPAEVAGAIVYLASPAASFVTGSALAVDGGLVAG
ncbi:MAG TPA: glucose 1-dehydrogenase [Acidimicrobiales bacterium]